MIDNRASNIVDSERWCLAQESSGVSEEVHASGQGVSGGIGAIVAATFRSARSDVWWSDDERCTAVIV